MLNHSCDPNISKYFTGCNVVAVANRKIRKGEEVTENYFPSYTHIGIMTLRSQIKFPTIGRTYIYFFLIQYWWHRPRESRHGRKERSVLLMIKLSSYVH